VAFDSNVGIFNIFYNTRIDVFFLNVSISLPYPGNVSIKAMFMPPSYQKCNACPSGTYLKIFNMSRLRERDYEISSKPIVR